MREGFAALCFRVRAVVLKRYGPVASAELLMLLDLIEILGIDKQDRVREREVKDESV